MDKSEVCYYTCTQKGISAFFCVFMVFLSQYDLD